MSDINQVRQILMNELGLTREVVRSMAQSMVEQAVEKHVNSLINSGYIEKFLDGKIVAAMGHKSYGRESLRALVTEAAGKAFAEKLSKGLADARVL